MTDREFDLKMDELDRLLNDPDSPMDPSKVWQLAAEMSQRAQADSTPPPVS